MLTAFFPELLVCIFLGYASITVTLKINLVNFLIMSLFLYGLEVWASAYQRKKKMYIYIYIYLDRIDFFFRRAYGFVYTNKV